mmetsp:Transcript_24140/g.74442  ORF Transcript_24140/g.74442 Transcript_24140/m.74442 type:complete len:219 (+) Transcript_24140:202-858(+)
MGRPGPERQVRQAAQSQGPSARDPAGGHGRVGVPRLAGAAAGDGRDLARGAAGPELAHARAEGPELPRARQGLGRRPLRLPGCQTNRRVRPLARRVDGVRGRPRARITRQARAARARRLGRARAAALRRAEARRGPDGAVPRRFARRGVLDAFRTALRPQPRPRARVGERVHRAAPPGGLSSPRNVRAAPDDEAGVPGDRVRRQRRQPLLAGAARGLG